MTRGACLCGVVQYELSQPTQMAHCHCSMCRKHHGAPFATFAVAPSATFRWIDGEDAIAPKPAAVRNEISLTKLKPTSPGLLVVPTICRLMKEVGMLFHRFMEFCISVVVFS